MARGMAWARIWPRAAGWRHHRGGLWAGLLRLRALLWAALRLLPRSLLWAVLGTAPVLWLAPLRLASLSPLVDRVRRQGAGMLGGGNAAAGKILRPVCFC